MSFLFNWMIFRFHVTFQGCSKTHHSGFWLDGDISVIRQLRHRCFPHTLFVRLPCCQSQGVINLWNGGNTHEIQKDKGGKDDVITRTFLNYWKCCLQALWHMEKISIDFWNTYIHWKAIVIGPFQFVKSSCQSRSVDHPGSMEGHESGFWCWSFHEWINMWIQGAVKNKQTSGPRVIWCTINRFFSLSHGSSLIMWCCSLRKLDVYMMCMDMYGLIKEFTYLNSFYTDIYIYICIYTHVLRTIPLYMVVKVRHV